MGVLIRFRENPIALVSDIEQTFHQIRVHSNNCNALRFLWWPNGYLAGTPVLYQMMVYLFGVISSPSCAAFSLRQTAYDFGKDFDTSITSIAYHNFCVDDCLCSVPTVSKGKEVAKKLPNLMSEGGFRLTEWLTNNNYEVLEYIPVSERSSSLQHHELNSQGTCARRFLEC